MKKMLIAMLAVIIIALPLVLAEDTQVMDNETESQIGLMDSAHGAAIRLLELEKSVTKNIMLGNWIVDALRNSSKNTTDLESILMELEVLNAEIKSADPASANATAIFVDLKSDALDLTKEFRDTVHGMLAPGEIALLRPKLNMTLNLKDLNDKIKENTKEYNTEKLRAVFSILNITDASIIDKFTNGNATRADVLKVIQDNLKSMTPQERNAALQAIKEAGVKKNIFIKAAVQKAKLNNMERKETRLTNRLEKVKNWTILWNATDRFNRSEWNGTMHWNETGRFNRTQPWNGTMASEHRNWTAPWNTVVHWNLLVQSNTEKRIENRLRLINHKEDKVKAATQNRRGGKE
jgi:hypothetical protein